MNIDILQSEIKLCQGYLNKIKARVDLRLSLEPHSLNILCKKCDQLAQSIKEFICKIPEDIEKARKLCDDIQGCCEQVFFKPEELEDYNVLKPLVYSLYLDFNDIEEELENIKKLQQDAREEDAKIIKLKQDAEVLSFIVGSMNYGFFPKEEGAKPNTNVDSSNKNNYR